LPLNLVTRAARGARRANACGANVDPSYYEIGGVSPGKRPALLAEVRLPAPSGGQGTYRGVLHFSDHTPIRVSASEPRNIERPDAEPHQVHLAQLVELEAREALVLEQMVEEAFAYAGCFTFVVWDSAGHAAQTSACLRRRS